MKGGMWESRAEDEEDGGSKTSGIQDADWKVFALCRLMSVIRL